jgi:acyl-CoA thioesterase I
VNISRRTLILFVVIAASIAAIILWRNRGWDYSNLPPRAAGPWVAFGDSLTAGFGAAEGGDYPTQLSKRIGTEIRNMGVPGETSADGLRRLPAVEEIEPRVVLLCFGGNDVLQNRARDQMIANVGSMIDRLQARGAFVVLLGVRGGSIVGDRNASAFKDLAREKKVLFVPNILDEIFNQPAMMFDFVHPNDAGYARIAQRVEDALKPVMDRLK